MKSRLGSCSLPLMKLFIRFIQPGNLRCSGVPASSMRRQTLRQISARLRGASIGVWQLNSTLVLGWANLKERSWGSLASVAANPRDIPAHYPDGLMQHSEAPNKSELCVWQKKKKKLLCCAPSLSFPPCYALFFESKPISDGSCSSSQGLVHISGCLLCLSVYITGWGW